MPNVEPVKKILLILLFLTFTSSVFADDKMALGLDIYNNKAMCGTCHTLQAADSEGFLTDSDGMLEMPVEIQFDEFVDKCGQVFYTYIKILLQM